MSSSSSSSHRKSSTLSLNANRNKPLPPILLDTPSSNNLPKPLQTPPILGNETPILGTADPQAPSIFQPKTLKRRNLKKLTLTDEPTSAGASASSSPVTGFSLQTPSQTPRSAVSSKEDLELLENFEKLTLSINKTFELKQRDLLNLKTLGEGQSGVVSQVLHVPTNKIMAKKQIMFEKTFKVQNQILRELKILNEVKSPFVIDFYGAVFIDNGSASAASTVTPETKQGDNVANGQSEGKQAILATSEEVAGIYSNGVIMCIEYMDCGSLDYILAKLGFVKEVYLSKITYAVLQGLNYLYTAHKIIHRDIKPSNVLLNSKGEVKICDLGVSRELNNNSIADTFVGTSTYMSPERIQGDVYSIKGDVWSLGLMLIELATGEFPFGKKDTPNGILDLLQRIVNEDPPSLPRQKYSKELCDFVDLCLKKQQSRPTPQELLNLPSGLLRKYEKEESGPLLRHLAKKLKK